MKASNTKNPSHTKAGPGRKHLQGNSRKGTSPKFPGTSRPEKEKPIPLKTP